MHVNMRSVPMKTYIAYDLLGLVYRHAMVQVLSTFAPIPGPVAYGPPDSVWTRVDVGVVDGE